MKAIEHKRALSVTALLACLAVMLLSVCLPAWAQNADADRATVKAATNDSLAKYLADAQGRSLYFSSADSRTVSTCYDFCAKAYPPYTTGGRPIAGDGVVSALLGTLQRDDGKMQVTYAGHPLYHYTGDLLPGSTAGASKRFGTQWHAIAPGGKIAQAKTSTGSNAASSKEKTAGKAQAGSSENPFAGDPKAVAEGKKLYLKVGCYGCHGRSGGGGMGPSLVDSQWAYGSSDADLFKTITQGRPKGMPAWDSHFTDDEVWQIIAFVRSLSK